MIRTILFFFYLALMFLLVNVFFIPVFFLWLFRMQKTKDKFVRFIAMIWARHMIYVAGGRVTVAGKENVPKDVPFCVVGNHQGLADIPLVIGYLGKAPGFVAKKELFRIPFMSWWMHLLFCIPLDRKNARQALKAIEKAIQNVKNGHAMLIFPEGTRSKGKPVADFKAGSLTLAMRSEAAILPITIDGSYRIWEEKNRISKGRVILTIHPPLLFEDYRNLSKPELAEKLKLIISQNQPGQVLASQ